MAYDPYLPDRSTADSIEAALENVLCAVVATAHDLFLQNTAVYQRVKLVVDGRDCLDKDAIRKKGPFTKESGHVEAIRCVAFMHRRLTGDGC